MKTKRKIKKNEKGFVPIIIGFCGVVILFLAVGFALFFVFMGGGKSQESGSTSADVGEIPGRFIPIYKAAAQRYTMPWQLLPAVHNAETTFSTSAVTYERINDAGCCAGPMQFNVTDGTWDGYKDASSGENHTKYAGEHHIPSSDRCHAHSLVGKDGTVYGDGNTSPSPYDDVDAIFAAAKKLSLNGAWTKKEEDIRSSLALYNSDQGYINTVMDLYKKYLEMTK